MTPRRHKLLERQLRRATGADGALNMDQLLEAVSQAYQESDINRQRSDRTNKVMSEDLTKMLAFRERAVRLEEEKRSAETANRAKSQFLANMSHELRTPLNAILGYATLIREDIHVAQPHELAEDVDRILVSSRHLLIMINDILDMAQIEAGKHVVSPTMTEISLLIHETCINLGSAAEKRGNTLTVDVSPKVSSVYADPLRLKQCLINLLSNGCKFTQDGQVTLDVAPCPDSPGDLVRFTVRDTGIGMTEEQVSRVFKPFEQADSSITRAFGGTGLGLAITQRLITAMGGRIEVSSELGAGSCFTLIVPQSAPSAHGHDEDIEAAA